MKYKNVSEILPKELIEAIQEYIQGESIYIPKKDKRIKNNPTEYTIELQKRNRRIYTKHLEGMSNKQLAENFSLAESSIRRIIVKKRKEFESMAEKIKTLLSHWDLQNQNVKQIYDTTWQIGNDYVLKTYNESESLERNILINQHLNDMNIPVGETVKTSNGNLYVEDDGLYFLLSKKLRGSNIVKIKYGCKQAYAMGEIIADLHIAFKSFENKIELWDNSLLDEMNGWVKQSFENNGWQNIDCKDYENLIEKLENVYTKLPTQLIHRDVHFGNFLFQNDRFCGYIDFDLSQKNIRIFDLCYFVMSVLSEKEKFQITEEMWFDFAKNVFAGYNSKLTLTDEEKQTAVFVMECIELLFLVYFEGQDDSALVNSTYNIFKFINTNERTIARLLK